MSVVNAAGMLSREDLVPLEAILRTEELQRRPSRPPDHEAENRALNTLVRALANSPGTILQILAETILDVCRADSAGMSLVTKDETRFEWAAIAGAWNPHLGGGTPRHFGPCGDVLDHNAALLFTHWERRYPYLAAAMPLAEEGLLVPFHVDGKAVGTIWAIMHGHERKFDAEDLRLLESLGRFASAAYQAVNLRHADEQRRAALEVMQEAIEARRAMDRLNAELSASERRLTDLIAALPAAVYTTDAEGRITFYNQAAVDLAGREPTIGSDEWCVSWKLYWPDGSPMRHDECPMAVALKENRPIRGAEAIAERPDGNRVPFIPYPTPLRDPAGKLVGGVNMLVDISERKAAEEALRKNEEQLSGELTRTRHLQAISAELIGEQNVEALYQKLVDAAAAIMRSEYASMQMLYPERGTGGQLRLLAFRGFNPQAAKFWEWVRADSESTCGVALRTGRRTIAEDVSRCDFMAGTEDLETYLQTGIHAVQTTPLVSRTGRLLGMISTHWKKPHMPAESDLLQLDVLARQAADLIERVQAEDRLRESEEQLRLATEAADVGLWDVDPINDKLFWPRRVKAMFGISPDVPVTMADFYVGLHPEDRERVSAAYAAAVDPEKCAPYEVEYRTVGKEDGIIRWVAAKGRGLFENGKCVRVIGTAIDVTARKRVEEHRVLLVNELNHRVKNTLATVQAIAAQSFRGPAADPDAREAFEARLVALANVHGILASENWESLGIHEVVARVLEPHAGAAQLQVQGPPIRLSPKVALALAMGLHELATNAVKYGALSDGAGHVELTWTFGDQSPGTLRLEWKESGGPPVTAPRRKGFGSRLIERNLAHDLNGEAKLDYRPEGVFCTVTADLSRGLTLS